MDYRTRRPYPLPRFATALAHLQWEGFELTTEGGILCAPYSAYVTRSLRNAHFSVLRASGRSPRHERGDTQELKPCHPMRNAERLRDAS